MPSSHRPPGSTTRDKGDNSTTTRHAVDAVGPCCSLAPRASGSAAPVGRTPSTRTAYPFERHAALLLGGTPTRQRDVPGACDRLRQSTLGSSHVSSERIALRPRAGRVDLRVLFVEDSAADVESHAAGACARPASSRSGGACRPSAAALRERALAGRALAVSALVDFNLPELQRPAGASPCSPRLAPDTARHHGLRGDQRRDRRGDASPPAPSTTSSRTTSRAWRRPCGAPCEGAELRRTAAAVCRRTGAARPSTPSTTPRRRSSTSPRTAPSCTPTPPPRSSARRRSGCARRQSHLGLAADRRRRSGGRSCGRGARAPPVADSRRRSTTAAGSGPAHRGDARPSGRRRGSLRRRLRARHHRAQAGAGVPERERGPASVRSWTRSRTSCGSRTPRASTSRATAGSRTFLGARKRTSSAASITDFLGRAGGLLQGARPGGDGRGRADGERGRRSLFASDGHQRDARDDQERPSAPATGGSSACWVSGATSPVASAGKEEALAGELRSASAGAPEAHLRLRASAREATGRAPSGSTG